MKVVFVLATCLATLPVFSQETQHGLDAIFPPPINDVSYDASSLNSSRALPYQPVRSADVMWKQFTWRVIDIREKLNLPFAYPERPFMDVLLDAAANGQIQLYSPLDDDFSTALAAEEKQLIRGTYDTIEVFNPLTGQSTLEVVFNELDVHSIQRFRLKEAWFVDKATATLKVRILGIAPVKDEYDEQGNFLFERPLFWVNYPAARQVLAQEQAYTFGNDASQRSWEDVLESRYFSSYIYKSSNVYDRRISAHLTGRDALMEGERIEQGIFNYEHDLWSY